MALVALPDADAAIAGAANDIRGEHKPARIVGMQRGVGGVDDGGAGDGAVALLEHDGVAAGVMDLAIRYAQAAGGAAMNQPAIVRQLAVAALEGKAGQGDAV